MKNYIKITALLLVAFLIQTSVFAQSNTGITFSIIKKENKIIYTNTQNQKVIDFYVTGLNSQEEVNAFINKFKTSKMVVDIVISFDASLNQWLGTARFGMETTRLYIKNTLIGAGVDNVIIDGKTIATVDIPIKNTERDSETKTTE